MAGGATSGAAASCGRPSVAQLRSGRGHASSGGDWSTQSAWRSETAAARNRGNAAEQTSASST
eukprot:scaffold118188_cov36-Phaeocystis_antarctica.AAC.1